MGRAKCWFRRRPATSESLALTVLVGLAGVAAHAQGDRPPSEEAPPETSAATDGLARAQWPAEFREFLDSVAGFRAHFVQELWSEDQRLIEVAEGDVALQRPGRFRWHYVEPYEQLIVADGENLWMYDVDIAQVTRSDLAVDDPANPAALLTGYVDVEAHFDVVNSSSTSDEVWVELVPKDLASDYAQVRVGFARSGSRSTLSALEFVDGLSQTTVIHFDDAESNPELDAATFEFAVPEGVHVLGGPG